MSDIDYHEPITPYSSTIVEVLHRTARAHPDKPLLLCADEELKVPTVWVLLDSPDRVPRGTTGEVDVVGLRESLAAAQPASTLR
ncbi:hypothetical protein [Nocardia sp. NPDC058480]|uniref:hypothetical protein n=1 Tax=unclassified Nocardia TaxID=2637762 RepID=UPI00365C3108